MSVDFGSWLNIRSLMVELMKEEKPNVVEQKTKKNKRR